ncbi:IS3 family transposase [Limnobacter humi]|uniref:IS3 family transposase n=1 Tax=Limnobacter humi TaxID=1778671 RepID=UPI00351C34F7
MTALRTRKADWVDRRKAPPRPDDDQLFSDIINVAKDLPTYGYRRVWAILKFQGVNGGLRMVNHKRVYRVMRDNNLLLFRHGSISLGIRVGTTAKWLFKVATLVGARTGLNCLATTVKRSE